MIQDTGDLIDYVRLSQHYCGKYISATLLRLEEVGVMTPEVRRTILKGFNKYARAMERVVGYDPESSLDGDLNGTTTPRTSTEEDTLSKG